jgi:mannan endo-1,4-beta-mannosidase
MIEPVMAQSLNNKNATKETVALYKNLHRIKQKHTLFGHQDDLAYGANWRYIEGKSDIKDVVNDYPAVYGWDISGIEIDSKKNIDGVPFYKMRDYIQAGYKRGSVITLSWHFDNPLTKGSSWDTTKNTVKSILPGGIKHELYKLWLDKAANYIHTLKGPKGEAIPILFRPFHELTGSWFWWGKNFTTVDEIKQAWKFTADYLTIEKKLNNLIFVYNTNDFKTEAEFLERYPGDEYIDVLSYDFYQFSIQEKDKFIAKVRQQNSVITKLAKERNKLAAFAETGFEAIPLSYVLVWRNAGYMESMKKQHYYGPFKGQLSEADFKKFYKHDKILFEKSTRLKKLYQ